MSTLRMVPVALALACALPAVAGPVRAEVAPRAPDDVAGLVAWYNLDPVHRRSREGEPVDRWADSSGHGHLLTATWDSQPPVFHPNRVNGKPEVTLRRVNHFAVHEPFQLDDHTIFIVYDSALTKRAFLSSELDASHGIVLRDDGKYHYYQNGKAGDVRYNRIETMAQGFTVTVLARHRGSLRSFINGADVSSGLGLTTPLRVGRLFHVDHTVRVSSDGEGMRIAEMAFYDRYLSDEERDGVTAHLADKFGLEVQFISPTREAAEARKEFPIDDAAVRVRASSRSAVDLNQPNVVVPWDVPGRVDRPFHFDAESGSARIVCLEEVKRARITVTLPLRTRNPAARLRLLILVDGREYLTQEGLSERFVGTLEERISVVKLQVELALAAGQSFHVVTNADGEPGAVWMPGGEALLLVEQIE